MVDQEEWMDVRSLWKEGYMIRAICRLTGLSRNTVRGVVRSDGPRAYERKPGVTKLTPFEDYVRGRWEETALSGVRILVADFEKASERAKAGDAVYFDPPYDPVSKTSNFTSYHKDEFGQAEHQRLKSAFARLAGRGVSVVLSNSHTAFTWRLFAEWSRRKLDVSRPINSKASHRGTVEELLVWSAPRK